MNKLKYVFILLTVLLLALSAACNSSNLQSTETPAMQEGAAYPVATTMSFKVDQAYPVAESPSPEPDTISNFVVPAPGAGTGVVIGQLLTPDLDGQPYITDLFLGDTIYGDGQKEAPPIISFSETESLVGIQNKQTGEFVFSDVPPGEYALIVWTPIFSMVVLDQETQQEVIFEVQSGETIDLGAISIPWDFANLDIFESSVEEPLFIHV